ncbi:MAG: MBOAT family protein [Clostridiales Family XIII bacterium]|nr:MBOAT family protein [Clostridiales Family XIII bacterium]
MLAYYILPGRKAKNIVLLLSSLFFYFWGEDKLIVILLCSILINYGSGFAIEKTRSGALGGKPALAIGIILNLALLGYFKYFDFAAGLLNATIHTDITLRNIVLPIGISFFTFQGITYIVDLYRGKVAPQKNLLKFGLYIALFPPLIAGPIVRYADVSEMIDDRHESAAMFAEGISRFVCGLAKKVLIANSVALICDPIFLAPVDTHSAATLWIGAFAYTLQIYFDFSGYSDMAIGLGLLFGFRFRENFEHPYTSLSIREFWRRWHISLSSFFRDYLYIPLGGSRTGNVYINLIIVFFATGLWHGAGLTFIVWGLWHGLFIVIENILRRRSAATALLSKIRNPFTLLLARIYTLLVVVLGWVIFRSESLAYAANYLRGMLLLESGTDMKVSVFYYLDHYNILVLILGAAFSFPLASALRKFFRNRLLEDRPNFYAALRVLCLAALLFWSAVKVIDQGYNPFIYFRF